MKIGVVNEPYSEDTTKECALGKRREVVGGTLRRKVEIPGARSGYMEEHKQVKNET